MRSGRPNSEDGNQVQAAEVVSVHAVNGTVIDGEFRRADPNPTRLFFGPTARSLKQGTGYAGVYGTSGGSFGLFGEVN